jgi:hypothetical protein
MSAVRVHKVVIDAPGAPRIGAMGGRSWFPVPLFGELCVCCDAPGQAVDYDPRSDRQSAEPITFPLCAGCQAHVARGHRLEVFLGGMTGGLGLILVFASLVLGSLALALGGVGLIGLVVAYLGYTHASKQASARHGHHRDFLIGVGGGFSVVRTTNPRVVQHLFARHPGAARLLP